MLTDGLFRKVHWTTVDLPKLRLHGLWGVYLGDLFRRLATSLIGLYIPIYIFKETGNLANIAFYYFIYAFIGFISNYPGALLVRKIGVDWSVALGTFFRGLFILFLIFASNNKIFFWLSAFFFGLCQPFDWLPYYYAIARVSFIKRVYGRIASLSTLVAKLSGILGPIIGGIIITNLGFLWLYVIAACVLIFAAVIPFFDDFEKKGMYVNGKELIKSIRDPGFAKHFFAYTLEMFDLIANMILWPVFLLMAVGTVEKSGLLQTASLLLGMVITYFTGRFVDKGNIKMMRLGSMLQAIGWWGRYLLRSSFGLFVANTSYSIGITLIWMPHRALLYARSSQRKTMEFWLLHELTCYAIISVICLFFMYILQFNQDLGTLLLLSGSVSLLTLLIPGLFKKYLRYLKK
jgi:YQGE family putative transporter